MAREGRLHPFGLTVGATALTAIIVAFVVEVAQGHDGRPYSWLGAIGGVAYLVAVVVLRMQG